MAPPDGEKSEEKKIGHWLSYRSSPYAWERVLLWAVLLACLGAETGAKLAHAALALLP